MASTLSKGKNVVKNAKKTAEKAVEKAASPISDALSVATPAVTAVHQTAGGVLGLIQAMATVAAKRTHRVSRRQCLGDAIDTAQKNIENAQEIRTKQVGVNAAAQKLTEVVDEVKEGLETASNGKCHGWTLDLAEASGTLLTEVLRVHRETEQPQASQSKS